MDIIYTDSNFQDAGVLTSLSLEMEIGGDNDFTMTVPKGIYNELGGRSIIYAEGTEYGGIIDGSETETSEEDIVYTGTTWRGILNKKVIEPDSGEDYYTVSGDANTIIEDLIERLSLTDLFEAESEASGITVKNYSFDRYIKGCDGIAKMLKTVGGKISIAKTGEKVTVSAVPSADFSSDDYTSDIYQFEIKSVSRQTNHLICLGQGELAARTVVHLYVDGDGNISETQTFTGIDEITETYENTAEETEEGLRTAGIEHLEDEYNAGSVSIQEIEEIGYDIGDTISVKDIETGLNVTAKVTSKAIMIEDGYMSIDYSIGG